MKKKILVISQDDFELTTDNVIDWILYYNADFIRVNGNFLNENDSNTIFNSENNIWNILKSIDFKSLHSIWFRRWSGNNLIHEYGERLNNKSNSYIFQKHFKIIENIQNENDALTSFFFYNLNISNIKFLTRPHQASVNKLVVLDIAKNIGLNVAEYIITNNKEDIQDFLKKYEKAICKDINVAFTYFHPLESSMTYAELIDTKRIKSIPNSFYPSLIQQYIEKSIEIRVFFLHKEIYSMAIFSQNDKQTKTDFRKYNLTKPNRTVPYNLPEIIKKKICQLMEVLNLETGSIDLIKTKENEYYFLEVNPVGQFGMVSFPCNYFLEEKIAKYLTQ